MRSALTPLQHRIAEEFFAREQRFVLTGGGALGGFLLGHRGTKDLDFFSSAPLQEEGERALRGACAAIGASLEAKITSPGFRRYVVRTTVDSCVVDLVHDEAPKGDAAQLRFGAVIVDPPEEILANKLCTLLSRFEPRDLVDVFALERAGYRVEDALALAQRKDGGFTPAQLSFVLSQVSISATGPLPGETSPAALRAFLAELVVRLAQKAHPSQS